MKESATLPIGSLVTNRASGEGIVIGYFSGNAEWHLIEFIKANTGMHDGHSDGVGKNGEKVVGKAGHCFYLPNLAFKLVEDFEGNV